MNRIKSAIMCCIVAVVASLSCIVASAEVSDVKIDCEKAKLANNSNKSISVPADKFKMGRITEDTQVLVTFEIEKGDAEPTESPVNLVLQCTNDKENTLADSKGAVWAVVAPKTYDATSAIFYYSDIVRGFTSKDFSKVDYLHVIAGEKFSIKVTSMTITSCNDKVPETTTTTQKPAETAAPEVTTQATTAPAVVSSADSSSSSSSTILLIGGIAAGIIITVIIVIVIMNRKSSEAFDVSTGEFINKKNLFEPSDENDKDDKSEDK